MLERAVIMSTTHKDAIARAGSGPKPQLRPIGVIRSRLKKRGSAPMQGYEGAPDAWLEVKPFAIEALEGLTAGSEVIVITWFHRAKRDVLKVYPRSDRKSRLMGVFAI